MASAAHVYGKRIIGAEAFTATDDEKWQGHPANIKDLGDWAFCEGINRFVFHRYALQPWTDRRPGMSMGPWGLHYERTQTWWEQSQPGTSTWPAASSCCGRACSWPTSATCSPRARPRGSPAHGRPTAPGYAARPARLQLRRLHAEVVLTRMSVKDGRLVLPDGMSYRVLVLPDVETMTPALLGKVKELVEAGATVVGPVAAAKVAQPGRLSAVR